MNQHYQFTIQESCHLMEDEQIELMLSFKKSKSDDSLFGLGKYIRGGDNERRNLILEPQENHKQPTLPQSIFKKKIKKQKKTNPCDYKKNICGYITKKIIREYLSSTYLSTVQSLCNKHGCSYTDSKSYYISQIERITGPSHLPTLFIPETPTEVTIKAAFREFFQWFLQERYLRYLLIDGKMENKSAYIQYKNNHLMMMLRFKDPLNQPTQITHQLNDTSS